MFESERKDQEWIKNWLSFLPEIKQEIQSFLELPQNAALPSGVHRSESTPFRELANNIMPFSRLQECLARLDRLPHLEDILNETDSTKLRLIFGEFQQVKLNARVEILTLRTNMEGVVEDHGRYRQEFGILHSWAALILPFSHVPARLLVTCKKDSYRIVFATSFPEPSISTSLVQMSLASSWKDPIEEQLQRLNLFQEPKQLSLDGIEYELSCHSGTSTSIIGFGNPSTSLLIEIESVFFSIAEMVVNEKGQQAEKNYLTEWRRYLADQNA